jgi:hypothetical protein
VDWDWPESWPVSDKQKERYKQFRGESAHIFTGDVDAIGRPTSQEGDAWEEPPKMSTEEARDFLKRSIDPTNPFYQGPAYDRYKKAQLAAILSIIQHNRKENNNMNKQAFLDGYMYKVADDFKAKANAQANSDWDSKRAASKRYYSPQGAADRSNKLMQTQQRRDTAPQNYAQQQANQYRVGTVTQGQAARQIADKYAPKTAPIAQVTPNTTTPVAPTLASTDNKPTVIPKTAPVVNTVPTELESKLNLLHGQTKQTFDSYPAQQVHESNAYLAKTLDNFDRHGQEYPTWVQQAMRDGKLDSSNEARVRVAAYNSPQGRQARSAADESLMRKLEGKEDIAKEMYPELYEEMMRRKQLRGREAIAGIK